MSRTCRELSALIQSEKDGDVKAQLEKELSLREKSHRDVLKAKEKALRGKESTSLRELLNVQAECENELVDNDSILKRIRASVFSKESSIEEAFEAKLSKKHLSFKQLEDIYLQVQEELDASVSPSAKALIKRVGSMLESRRNSHKNPLAQELDAIKENATMKTLAKFRQALLLEVSESDELVKELNTIEKKRDSTVRAKLVSRFTQMIRDIKKIKNSSPIYDFLKECEQELDDNDALLSQVRSTLETKLLESKGLKKVHNLDELERGERERLTDDKPVSRSSRKSKDSESKKKSSRKDGSSSSSSVLNTSIVYNAMEVLSGFKSDLSGAPPTSAIYKLGILLVFVMYVAIVSYSTSLAFKVAKFEIDLSKMIDGRNSLGNSADPSAASDGSNTASNIVAPPAAPKQEASYSTAKGDGDDDDD